MRKELIALIEDNIAISIWLDHRVQGGTNMFGYSRGQLRILVHIYTLGRMMLKDIARRSDISPSNLCTMLRHLEQDGLVDRKVDEADRRNTWYSLTSAGTKIARGAMDEFGKRIDELFSGLNKKQELQLTEAIRNINEILNSIKTKHEEQPK
jgi:DNA-binding MarR family transcriptional regulator